MGQRLSDRLAKTLPPPAKGNRVYYDADLKGFGLRVTGNGARAFVLNYRNKSGRERRLTIGSFPAWSVSTAREEAKGLLRRIEGGEDPQADRHEYRTAPTMAELAARYVEEHLPSKRASSQDADKMMLETYVLPAMGKLKVAEVDYAAVSKLHRGITKDGKPIRANRVLALLGKMFSLAEHWGIRAGHPTKGAQKNPEEPRERYLEPSEIERLMRALVDYPDKQAANAIMLALLTGARRGEVVNALWDQFDLSRGVWIKPSSLTKQKKTHRVPLSSSALELMRAMRGDAAEDAVYVFPGKVPGQPRENVRRPWEAIRKAAGLEDVRFHDLRHSYASLLINDGVSLPIIGRLLGHSHAKTTMRYAHLADDPLRAATSRVGEKIAGLRSVAR